MSGDSRLAPAAEESVVDQGADAKSITPFADGSLPASLPTLGQQGRRLPTKLQAIGHGLTQINHTRIVFWCIDISAMDQGGCYQKGIARRAKLFGIDGKDGGFACKRGWHTSDGMPEVVGGTGAVKDIGIIAICSGWNHRWRQRLKALLLHQMAIDIPKGVFWQTREAGQVWPVPPVTLLNQLGDGRIRFQSF